MASFNCERNILLLRILRICMMSMAFPIATIVAFWESNGVSLQGGLILQAIFAVALAVFEVPSGYLADSVGRKRSLTMGGLVLLVGSYTYFVGESFVDFAIAELFFALGFALISGADEALLYDSLLSAGREHEHRRLWGKICQGEFIMVALSILLGGILAQQDLRLPYVLTMSGFLLYALSAFFVVEPERQKLIADRGHLREMLEVARFCAFERPRLRWLILYSGVMVASLQICFWLYQPYIKELGLGLEWNGWIIASLNLVAAFSVSRAYRVEERLGLRASMQLSVALLAGSLLVLSSVNFPFAWCLFWLHQMVRAVHRVVLSDAINREARSEVRATIISLRGLSDRLIYAVVLIPFSLFAEEMGASGGFLLLAILTLFGSVLVLRREPGRARRKHLLRVLKTA